MAASSSLALTVVAPIALLSGDYPDPSAVRVGSEYWASATSSAWAPEFPLLHSRDLVHWRVAGAVFDKRPEWADGAFWAPEISEYKSVFSVFYSAKMKNGPMCVAVATAPRPQGPYLDHGPLVCEEVGSIDGAPATDENGHRHLIWKRDGNSVREPTPIFAQRLGDDGISLVGEPTELIRNDTPWEGPLVEGAFVLRRNGWFYMFYSGAACCSRSCDYAVGVARSRKLLGPWEKNPMNPILAGNDEWHCPGHGSVTTNASGNTFFVYHAMSALDSVYVGRQLLVDEIKWDGLDGWPTINGGNGPANALSVQLSPDERRALQSFEDDFSERTLRHGWQWPQDNEPLKRVSSRQGVLFLGPNEENEADLLGAVLARSAMSSNYEATTRIDLSSLGAGLSAGLAAYGSAQQALGLSVRDGQVTLWQRTGKLERVFQSVPLPPAIVVDLTMTVENGSQFAFSAKADGRELLTSDHPLDGHTLPPWDLGVRVALVAGGAKGLARFKWLKIRPLEEKRVIRRGTPTS